MPDDIALTVATDVMLYMSAQNDLAQKAQENIGAIYDSRNLDGLCVYIMLDTIKLDGTDAPENRNTWEYRLPPGATEQDFVRHPLPAPNKDVIRPAVFRNFLTRAEDHFANRATRQKILVLWGHGGGMVMLDEERAAGAERARASIAEFATVLEQKAREGAPLRFDILAFDSCFMCMIETMHQLKGATDYALCSSTLVDADGYPYKKIFDALKSHGGTWNPRIAAQNISTIYNQHYQEILPDQNRYLFVCDVKKTDDAITALNVLGTELAKLMKTKGPDDPVRLALGEALIAAGVDSSYVYILRFLDALAITLEGRFSDGELTAVHSAKDTLEKAVRNCFIGDLGSSTDNPVSPLIWAPFQRATFVANETKYNALDASQDGHGGWVSLWRAFHEITAVAPPSDEGENRYKIGLAKAV
jgi:hypothetical protein